MEEVEERARLDRVDGTCVRTCLVSANTLKTRLIMFRGPERWKTSVAGRFPVDRVNLNPNLTEPNPDPSHTRLLSVISIPTGTKKSESTKLKTRIFGHVYI